MIAVYSDLVFGDRSLYAAAEAAQRRYDLTLLTALDLPWQADGLQRDGAARARAGRSAAARRAGARRRRLTSRSPAAASARLEAALAAVDRAVRRAGA